MRARRSWPTPVTSRSRRRRVPRASRWRQPSKGTSTAQGGTTTTTDPTSTKTKHSTTTTAAATTGEGTASAGDTGTLSPSGVADSGSSGSSSGGALPFTGGPPIAVVVVAGFTLLAAWLGRRQVRRSRMTQTSPARTSGSNGSDPETGAAAVDRAVAAAWQMLTDAADTAAQATGGPVRIDVDPRVGRRGGVAVAGDRSRAAERVGGGRAPDLDRAERAV